MIESEVPQLLADISQFWAALEINNQILNYVWLYQVTFYRLAISPYIFPDWNN